MQKSKIGKCGHAKLYLTLSDIFTLKKSDTIIRQLSLVEIPVIVEHEYTLLDIAPDHFCTLLDGATGATRADLELLDVPAGFRDRVRSQFEQRPTVLTVLNCDEVEQITAFRDDMIDCEPARISGSTERVDSTPFELKFIPSSARKSAVSDTLSCHELSMDELLEGWVFVP